jgi:hypothetical protein
VAERDADGNSAKSSGSHLSNLRDRQAAYLPDGYELIPERGAKRLRPPRSDGSEAGSFEQYEIKKAEQAAFEDVRKRCRKRPL